MRTKLNGLLTLLLAFVVHISFAQDKTITGTVTDGDGLPLPGVNIVVEGTTTGTQTDFDGNYAITASEGQTILFTYIGQRPATRVVGAESVINVQMEADTQALEEVVVTAQGIKREKKALGYAVSSVGAEDLNDKTEGDVARVLSGKASGVNITSAGGMSGSATNVVIRGLSSFSGSNQALFVVDGVPFSSDTNTSGDFLSGNPGSSRFLDMDPNNIANIEVLKGLAASTLYGTAGKNGVILITTKAGAASGGKKKNEITVSQSYFVNALASLPDYQSEYGNGFDQAFGWFFSNWGPSFDREGVSGWGNPNSFPAVYDMDENGTIRHPYATTALASTRNAFPELQDARYAWQPYNSVEDFLAPGGVSNTSINITGATDDGKTSYNVNMGLLDDESFVPGNSISRFNISVGGRSQLSNKFTVSAVMNYSKTDYKSPPVAASRGNGSLGLSLFGHVFFTPRSVDLMGLPWENPLDKSSVYYRSTNGIINPRWVENNVKYRQQTNRVFWNASLAYALNDNMNVTYRAGLDFYNERNTNYSNKGGVGFDQAIFGFLDTYDNNNTIWDHYLAVDGNYDLSEKLGMSFTAGATVKSTAYDRQGVASSGQIVYGVTRHFNYESQTPIQRSFKQNIAGVLGQATFDFDNMLFLSLATRTDWVSNLTTENNSMTYPSASISFLPTAAFSGMQSPGGLNFLKLRAGIGQSATFPSAGSYPTAATVDQSTMVFGDSGEITTNAVSSRRANPDLKPELLTEYEVGFESKFLNNAVSLDFTYFDRVTKDLIVNEPLSPSTGFTTTQSNVGKIKGSGVEIDLGIDWFRSETPDGFNWNSRLNFSTYKPKVVEQEQDIIIYAGSSTLWVGGNAAIEGKPLGVIVGTAIGRDEDGNFLVSGSGDYVSVESDLNGDVPIIGDPNPDFTSNFINSIRYKNWNLGFQFNWTKGGDMMSNTIATLLGRGLITETLDREQTYVLPGVSQSTGEANTVHINNSSYYFDNVLFGPAEMKIYDASVVRLQELSLGYSFPSKFLDKTPFGSLTITAQGFNLWFDAYNTPDGANFDPNVMGAGVGNSQGFDFINGPASKKYGVSVKMTF